MKRLAFLCLVLIAGVAVLAQQPAEWRPKIAEDNKVATLDDTLHFLVTFVPQSSSLDSDGALFRARLDPKADRNSARSCMLAVRQTFWTSQFDSDKPGSIVQWRDLIDLSKLDPLSIRVVPASDGPLGNYLEVYFENRDREPLGEKSIFETNQVARPAASVLDQEFECSSDHVTTVQPLDRKLKKNAYCSVRSPESRYSYQIFIDQQESAHRVASALMHAALLCGGVKAVSPF
jgi:hypothetical protein